MIGAIQTFLKGDLKHSVILITWGRLKILRFLEGPVLIHGPGICLVVPLLKINSVDCSAKPRDVVRIIRYRFKIDIVNN